MKFTDYLIVFAFLFIAFGIVLFLNGNVQDRSSTSNTEYADTLTIACNDAMKVANMENTATASNVWEKDGIRNEALKVFYNTLNLCFNTEYTEKENDVKIFTPVVVLIDNDGYYISYNSSFDNTGKVYIKTNPSAAVEHISLANSGQYSDSMTSSPLNSWTEEFGNFTVRYFLNDTVEISYTEMLPDPTGVMVQAVNTIKGKRLAVSGIDESGALNTSAGWSELQRNVKASIDNAALPGITEDILKASCNTDGISLYDVIYNTGTSVVDHTGRVMEKTKDSAGNDVASTHVTNATYQSAKISCMVRCINDEVTYYVNYQNIGNSKYNVAYKYVMPEVSSATWHRLLENPTIISFLQGNQQSTGQTFANVFSTSGGEIIKGQRYYITRELDASGNPKLDAQGKPIIYYHYLEATNCPYYQVKKRVKSNGNNVNYSPTSGTDSEEAGGGSGDYDDEIIEPGDIDDDGYDPGGGAGDTPDTPRGGFTGVRNAEKALYNMYVKKNKATGEETPLGEVYDSMEECVDHGARPCECAINHNYIPPH